MGHVSSRLCRRDVRRRLCPADSSGIDSGLCPCSGFALQIYWAKGRTKGIAQNAKGTFTAGHSHRRTPGGKAEPDRAYDF